jgi:predicted RecB family endonuclease
LAKNWENGKLGEKAMEKIYRGIKGIEVVGTQVKVQTTKGKRYIDVLLKVNGKLVAVEVKTGKAIRSVRQIEKDAAMLKDGVKIGGVLEFISTVVRRPF